MNQVSPEEDKLRTESLDKMKIRDNRVVVRFHYFKECINICVDMEIDIDEIAASMNKAGKAWVKLQKEMHKEVVEVVNAMFGLLCFHSVLLQALDRPVLQILL